MTRSEGEIREPGWIGTPFRQTLNAIRDTALYIEVPYIEEEGWRCPYGRRQVFRLRL